MVVAMSSVARLITSGTSAVSMSSHCSRGCAASRVVLVCAVLDLRRNGSPRPSSSRSPAERLAEAFEFEAVAQAGDSRIVCRRRILFFSPETGTLRALL